MSMSEEKDVYQVFGEGAEIFDLVAEYKRCRLYCGSNVGWDRVSSCVCVSGTSAISVEPT